MIFLICQTHETTFSNVLLRFTDLERKLLIIHLILYLILDSIGILCFFLFRFFKLQEMRAFFFL